MNGDMRLYKKKLKKIWIICFEQTNGNPAAVEAIASSYYVINRWIMQHTWANTVTSVEIKQTINEIEES